MSMQLLHKVSEKFHKKKVPVIKTGMTVKVHQRIQEGNKTRVQVFEGLVIKTSSGFGTSKTFTVRKIVDGIGVEKIFPIHSTNIEKIEVLKQASVKRSKLYFIRKRRGKSARLKEKHLTAEEIDYIELEEAPVKAKKDDSKSDDKKSDDAKAETPKEETKTEEVAEEKVEEKAPEAKVEDKKAEAEKAETPAKEEKKEEQPKEEKKEEPKEEAKKDDKKEE